VVVRGVKGGRLLAVLKSIRCGIGFWARGMPAMNVALLV